MLMDTSNWGSVHNPAAKEMGIPRVTQKASRRFKKRASRMQTNTRPIAMFFISS